MEEYNNVREALRALLDINLKESEYVVYANGVPLYDEGSQEINVKILIQVCDLLGMSDIYLNNRKYHPNNRKNQKCPTRRSFRARLIKALKEMCGVFEQTI